MNHYVLNAHNPDGWYGDVKDITVYNRAESDIDAVLKLNMEFIENKYYDIVVTVDYQKTRMLQAEYARVAALPWWKRTFTKSGNIIYPK